LGGAEEAAEQTALYDQNVGLTDKSHIASFAGYLMPLRYSSIAGDHSAVREAAGIFDCTDMGVLEISQVGAAKVTDQLIANNITDLKGWRAQCSFRQNDGVLDKQGMSIGWVLSCAGIAGIGEGHIALVYVDRESLEENDAVGLYYSARSHSQIQRGGKKTIEMRDLRVPDPTGKVSGGFAKF
jgi:glycine cleavage system aminomethyltransferase T